MEPTGEQVAAAEVERVATEKWAATVAELKAKHGDDLHQLEFGDDSDIFIAKRPTRPDWDTYLTKLSVNDRATALLDLVLATCVWPSPEEINHAISRTPATLGDLERQIEILAGGEGLPRLVFPPAVPNKKRHEAAIEARHVKALTDSGCPLAEICARYGDAGQLAGYETDLGMLLIVRPDRIVFDTFNRAVKSDHVSALRNESIDCIVFPSPATAISILDQRPAVTARISTHLGIMAGVGREARRKKI